MVVTYQHFAGIYFNDMHRVDYRLIDDLLTYTSQLTLSKDKAIHQLYPHSHHKRACVMMMVANLAQPDWLYVNCDEKLIGDTFCSISFNTHKYNNIGRISSNVCSHDWLLSGNNCFQFIWISGRSEMEAHITAFEPVFLEQMGPFHEFLNLQNLYISPLLVRSLEQNKALLQTFSPIYEHYEHKILNVSDGVSGFGAFYQKAKKLHKSQNLFKCSNGINILQLHVCDTMNDCAQEESHDEHFCSCPGVWSNVPDFQLCKIMSTVGKMKCSPVYFMNKTNDCAKFYNPVEQKHLSATDSEKYHCKDMPKKIDQVFVDDLFADCGPNAHDEPLLLSLLKFGKVHPCEHENEIPCLKGHTECYNFSDTCNLRFDAHNKLQPCRNGGHLTTCKQFECNVKFKCPDYYCIPFTYLCDDKWDCPFGDDEAHLCHNSTRCVNMYKCKTTSNMVCVHLASVCDTIPDCPSQDDEILCEIKHLKCPNTCFCLALALVCTGSKLHITATYPYQSVSLFSSSLIENSVLSLFIDARYITLIDTDLVDVCSAKFNIHLWFVSAQLNPISTIISKCFFNLSGTVSILLDQNNLRQLHSKSFFLLPLLQKVNLSQNYLVHLPRNIFVKTGNLKVVSMLANKLTSIAPDIFKRFSEIFIETTDYRVCCSASSGTTCVAKRPWHKSCCNLLPDFSVEVMCLVVSFLVMNLNCLSSIVHIRLHKRIFAKVALSVNLSDALIGVYLCFVWTANQHFLRKFYLVEEIWRSSLACYLAFGVNLLFNFVSPCTLFLLSLTRLQVVAHPLHTKFKKPHFVSNLIVVTFSSAVVTSAIIVFITTQLKSSLPSSLCIPFIDPEHSFKMLQGLIWLVTFFQTGMSFVFVAAHWLLIKYVQLSERSIQKSKLNSTFQVLFQLIIITASNILCWIPTNTIYLVSMFLNRYPSEMVLWTAVAVAPLNSIVNPTVLLIGHVKRKLKGLKMTRRTLSSRHTHSMRSVHSFI